MSQSNHTVYQSDKAFKMKLSTFLSTAFALFAGAALGQEELTASNAGARHLEIEQAIVKGAASGSRDLQLVNLACGIIGNIIPGDVTCACAVTTSVDFGCVFNTALCIGGENGFCAAPTIAGTINILTFTVGFEFCAASATNGGVPVPGVCIDFGAEIEGGLLGADSTPTACSASVGGKSCSSCDICDEGAGYTFDCSEISPELVQSTCTPVHLISSLNPNQEFEFMPHLD